MTATLGELLDCGVVVQAHEAVAIVQQLIDDAASVGVSASPDPPSVANIQLGPDGIAFAAGCDETPSVVEAAILLQAMLPARAGQVPGGLRYAIARALQLVDAPAFASIAELSRVLERFERGDRRASVRELLERARAAQPPPVVPRVPALVADKRVPIAPMAPLPFDELPLRPPTPPELFASSAPPPHEGEGYGRLWVVAGVLVGAVALAGAANRYHIDTFRLRLPMAASSAPAPGLAVPQTVPSTVPQTVSGPVPGAVPQTVSGPVPPTVPGTIAGTVPQTVSGTSGTSDSDVDLAAASAEPDAEVVAAVDAQQRPVFSPAFASNGSAMFFHTGSTSDENSALAVVQAPGESGSDLRVMTIIDDGARNYHAQPSPNGQFVAFDSDRDGERGVYVANREGSQVRRISGPGYAAVPTWSPDGRRIAYIRAEPGQPKVWNLWLQDIDSDQTTQLTNYRFGQPWRASWFPDNRRICYTHEDKIVLMDLETRRTWTFDSPIKGRLVRTPAVSPDGTKVIFQVARDGAWMLDLSDRSMRRVLTDPTAEEFAWSPDGHRIAFHSRRDGQWSIYILHQG